MTAPLEKYTVTAYVDGTEAATADFYMNDATKHTYKAMLNYDDHMAPAYDVSSAYTDANGDVWVCLPSPTSITPSVYAYSDTYIWKYGDDVSNIYYIHAVGYKDWQELTEFGVNMIAGTQETNSNDYYRICDHLSSD